MKQACKKIAACLVATAFMVPVTLIAQEDQKVKEEKTQRRKIKR